MSNTYFDPAADLVLVAELEEDTSIDGILQPDNVRQQEMHYGSVVAVGPDAESLTKPHDRIAFGPFAGKHILVGGMQFRLIRQGQIEGYIRKTV